MLKALSKKFVKTQFQTAGIELDGKNPWDLHVHDDRFYHNVILYGSMGLGESYMNGWIHAQQLDETMTRILASELAKTSNFSISSVLCLLGGKLLNKQSKNRAHEVGKRHYDIGNDLFKIMLDKRLTYSCAYWKDAKNLDDAQEAKLDLVCKKLGLKPGMKVLDIGCGWGSFAKFAAEKYGVYVVGITISQKQLDLAKELCKGLPIELRYQDYRDLDEQFDHIVSIGQMEHVGYKNYLTYMQTVHKCLKKDGLFLLHTIGSNKTVKTGDPWIEKYIFPNGMLPSVQQLAKASEGLFVMEDWHNFGAYYDKTLMAWAHNFQKGWSQIKADYDETFYRMWNYYLLACAGTFRSRRTQLWQIVYSKKGVPGGYLSIR